MRNLNLKKYIKQRAQELEIDMIGFTSFKPLSHLKSFLEERKDKKYHTSFEEENIDLRIHPNLHLEEGKSIIAIGISYNVDNKTVENPKLKGSLSRASWGLDYHQVLERKMEELIEEIKKVQKFNYKYFVDKGPLIDREIAKQAGMGWYGKNCSIINNDFGSFFFIGYILTDLELEEDEAIKEECGDCTLCIQGCPVGAIEDNYIINANKCIAFLTQTKDKIPYELREKIGTKIYGCDTCQLICPKNKGVSRGKNQNFLPHDTGGVIDIDELIFISNEDFKKKYGSMSGSWRGKNILRRNAIISLGNMKDKDSINTLKKTIKDNSPMIREYSAWALLKIDKELGENIVKEHLKEEKSPTVKEEMERLLEYFN